MEPWPVQFCVYAPMLVCISFRVVSYGAETSYEIVKSSITGPCGMWSLILD